MAFLADSNFWLALALAKHKFHADTRNWLNKLRPADELHFCRSTQQSVLRLLTTKAVLSPYGVPALTNEAAWNVYETFLANDRISWVREPRGLDSLWKELSGRPKASPKLWMDAYLAAFAIAAGHTLVTTDAAFQQFDGLELVLLPQG